MNPLSASHSTVCGLARKRYLRQTPLRDVAHAKRTGKPCQAAAMTVPSQPYERRPYERQGHKDVRGQPLLALQAPQRAERDGPMTPKAFHALFGRIGERAKMPFPVHPHMLRHGCGYALANAGHDTRALQAWLGHRNIQHTVRYTELAPDRFNNFWR
jgi:integrase